MVKNEVLIAFFSFLLGYTLLKVNSKVVVKIKNLECFPNRDWVDMVCKLKAVSWKKTLINVEAELKKNVKKLTIHTQVFKRYNGYQPFPLKSDFEFCSMIGGSGNNYYFAPLFNNIVNKFANFNHTCPYLKGEKLLVKDLDWQPFDFINMNLGAGGAGRYRLDIGFYANGAKTRSALIVGYADIE